MCSFLSSRCALVGARHSEFLRTFEYAYYLRTLDWGVILRNYPSGFQIFQQGNRASKPELDTSYAPPRSSPEP